jgi:hypothetical protein
LSFSTSMEPVEFKLDHNWVLSATVF